MKKLFKYYNKLSISDKETITSFRNREVLFEFNLSRLKHLRLHSETYHFKMFLIDVL
jgi:hypothetical protein